MAAIGIVSIVFQHYNEWNDLEETLERLFLNFSGKNKYRIANPVTCTNGPGPPVLKGVFLAEIAPKIETYSSE